MTESRFVLRRPTRVCVAALLACGCVAWAQADEGDQGIGIASSVELPAKAKGKPPAWSGKSLNACRGRRQGAAACSGRRAAARP